MTAKETNYLMIFVKNLIPGTVKTRLAQDIGMDAAMDVYKELLDYTAEVANKVETAKGVYYAQYVELYDDWDNEKYEKHVQEGNGLGDRMLHAFTAAFEKGFHKVVIIGSDSLEITKKHIDEAFAELEKHDVVIGPAFDGGYYLLGLNNIFPALFENKGYSHANVMAEAIDEIDKFGLSVKLLEQLHDVDTMEDLKRSGYEIIYDDDAEQDAGSDDEDFV
ncbi:MAG: TIGR04282 family arsenosugar biosynthesis glycosyltransferase [Bacteroidota bacterium]